MRWSVKDFRLHVNCIEAMRQDFYEHCSARACKRVPDVAVLDVGTPRVKSCRCN